MLAGDFNRDGKQDLAVLYSGPTIPPTDKGFSFLYNTTTYPKGACIVPVGPGINICSPGATSTSAVNVLAAGNVDNPAVYMELWVDGKRVTSYGSTDELRTTLSLNIGPPQAGFRGHRCSRHQSHQLEGRDGAMTCLQFSTLRQERSGLATRCHDRTQLRALLRDGRYTTLPSAGAAKHSETTVDPRGSIQSESDSAQAAGSGNAARTKKSCGSGSFATLALCDVPDDDPFTGPSTYCRRWLAPRIIFSVAACLVTGHETRAVPPRAVSHVEGKKWIQAICLIKGYVL